MSDDARFWPGQLNWKGRAVHVLWRTTGAADVYLFDSTRRLLRTWRTREELDAFAASEALRLESSTHLVSLDVVKDFVDARSGVDSESALNFWNFFIDLEAGCDSREFARVDQASNELYGKLFSMTSAGQLVGLPRSPLTIAQTSELREVMGAGLALFERVLAV